MNSIELALVYLRQNLFTSVLGCVLCYVTGLIISRLFFHPLSRIPGPKLAAISGWYSFYYNFIVDGQYSKSFEALHRRYSESQ